MGYKTELLQKLKSNKKGFFYGVSDGVKIKKL